MKHSKCNIHEKVSPGEPQCLTQFSELANLQTSVLSRSSATDISRKDTASAENTINLDLSYPLWSQISSSSSQPFSCRPAKRLARKRKTGEVLINAGVGTTPKVSSSTLHVVHDPPRFSQLLTQASQSKQVLPTATRTPDFGMRKRKSEVLYPTKRLEEADVLKDGKQDTPSRRKIIRDQILASLLQPDFEDFLAEVELVWDEIQEGVSTTWNLSSL